MIVREWRGRATRGNATAYPEHFRRNVLPELRGISGFLGASLLRADRKDDIEFVVLTRWATMDAIGAFAGADVTRAVVEPEAVAALVDFDHVVRHYDVLDDVSLIG
jgi:heme-degrading monooxygenase HmoA